MSIRFPKDVSDNLNFGNIVAGVSGKLPFVRFSRNPEICKKCGMKVFNGGRCPSCKSTSLIPPPLLILDRQEKFDFVLLIRSETIF